MEILNSGSGGGGMGGFFNRIKKLVSKELTIREVVSGSIKEVANITVEVNSVSVKGSTVSLKITNNAKNAIYIKKTNIINLINAKSKELLLGVTITDIK